jgi:hypothetical protein
LKVVKALLGHGTDNDAKDKFVQKLLHSARNLRYPRNTLTPFRGDCLDIVQTIEGYYVEENAKGNALLDAVSQ